jgi:hypothetical protein
MNITLVTGSTGLVAITLSRRSCGETRQSAGSLARQSRAAA